MSFLKKKATKKKEISKPGTRSSRSIGTAFRPGYHTAQIVRRTSKLIRNVPVR